MAIVLDRIRATQKSPTLPTPMVSGFTRSLLNDLEPFLRPSGDPGGWFPPVDIEETSEAVTLVAELPGFAPDAVDIQVENHVLTLSGAREVAQTEAEGAPRVVLQERRMGAFRRSFSLPRTVQSDAITATFEHGLLTVHMPKAEAAKSRKIEIRSAR
jgi:HSP20 family protein